MFVFYIHILYFALLYKFFFKMLKAKTINFKKQFETSKKHKSLTAIQKKKVYLKKISISFLKNKDLINKYDISKK